MENGLACPTVGTLKKIADHLDVLLFDLLTFPDDDERQQLTDALRHVSTSQLKNILREVRKT